MEIDWRPLVGMLLFVGMWFRALYWKSRAQAAEEELKKR